MSERERILEFVGRHRQRRLVIVALVLAVRASGLALVGASGCGAGSGARSAMAANVRGPVVAEPAVAMTTAAATDPPAAPIATAPVEPVAASLPAEMAPLRRDPRLDEIAATAAEAASRGYVVSTAALRDATVAGLGSDVLPYVITARGEDADTDAQLAAALGELRAAAALDAVGLAEARGATGRVVALVATPPPTVTVTAVRHGDDVSLTLAWPWPLAPSAYLSTPSRARRIAATLEQQRVAVIVRCRDTAAIGFGADVALEIDAGRRLIASVPAVCGSRRAAAAAVDVGPPARTVVEIEQRLFELVNQERAAHGLVALSWDAAAHAMARDHAADMARVGFVGHVGSTGATLTDRVLGHGLPAVETFENVGRAGGPGEAHAAFLASPGHRANLLAPAARRGAIGVALDPHDPDQLYVTEELFEPTP